MGGWVGGGGEKRGRVVFNSNTHINSGDTSIEKLYKSNNSYLASI